MKTLIFPAVLMLFGCAAAGTTTPVTLEFVEMTRGQHARGSDQHFELVTTAERLTDVWQRIGEAPPTVNFEQHSVIVLLMGQQTSGGHTVTAASVVRRGDVLHVAVRFRVPGAGCMTTQALTSPYQVVSIPAGARMAEFITETEAVSCQ